MKLFCLCCALAAAVITPTAAVANDKLTVATWGGAYSDSQNKAFFEPFMKAGNDLTIETYNGEIGRIRAQVKSKAVTWDVIDIDTQTALSACAEGLLEKIDWKKLGLDRETFIGAKQQVCAVPNIVYATVLAYDTTKLKTGPSKTADLFDLKAFPGKRGLRKSPVVNLEWALLADGVKQADLYALLRTNAGVDRAFRKLDTIKSEIIWWEAGAQPQQILSTGQVVMTSAWNGYVALAVKKRQQALCDDMGQPGVGLELVGSGQRRSPYRCGLQICRLCQRPQSHGQSDARNPIWPSQPRCDSTR